MVARGRLGEERAQRERGVGELCAVAGSASGIQVAVAGVMRCDPATRTFERERATGCKMRPIFGSQIGNVGLDGPRGL